MKKLLSINPEIARNAWQELSIQRLVAMPVLLGLVYVIAYYSGKSQTEYDSVSQTYLQMNMGFDYIYYAALVLFIGVVCFWGAKNASDGIVDEYNTRTWDWQRSHRLNPLQMMAGKLFGPTIYNWYGGVLLLASMLVVSPIMHRQIGSIFLQVPTMILMAVQCHCAAIVLALFAIRKSDGRGRVRNALYILASLSVLSQLSPDYKSVLAAFGSSMNGRNPFTVTWYYIPFSIQGFNLFSLCLWTSWLLFAVYRNFRTEYQYLNGSWAWVGFLVFIVLFQLGNISSWLYTNEVIELSFHKKLFLVGLFTMAQLGVLTYFTLVIEEKNYVSWKKCYLGFTNRDWNTFGHYAPLWLLSYLGFLAYVVFQILLVISGESMTMDNDLFSFKWMLTQSGITSYTITGFLFALPGFMLRDILIFLYLHAAPRHRRADGAAMIYLLVLYILIPVLLGVVGGDYFLFLFLPISGYSWIGAFLQAAIAFWVLRKKLVDRELLSEN